VGSEVDQHANAAQSFAKTCSCRVQREAQLSIRHAVSAWMAQSMNDALEQLTVLAIVDLLTVYGDAETKRKALEGGADGLFHQAGRFWIAASAKRVLRLLAADLLLEAGRP
jgi:hypothetical protein